LNYAVFFYILSFKTLNSNAFVLRFEMFEFVKSPLVGPRA